MVPTFPHDALVASSLSQLAHRRARERHRLLRADQTFPDHLAGDPAEIGPIAEGVAGDHRRVAVHADQAPDRALDRDQLEQADPPAIAAAPAGAAAARRVDEGARIEA